MKKVLAILLAIFLLLGSSTGVMAKPKKNIDSVVEPQLEVSTYTFEYDVPENIIAGEEVVAEVTLKTDELGENGYESVRLEFSVESDVLEDGDEVVFTGYDEDNDPFTFRLESGEKAVWGPSTFPLTANYNETTPWTIKFPKPGDYKITFKLLDLLSNTRSKYVITQETAELTVEPMVLKGFVSKNNKYYVVNGYRLTGDDEVEYYKDEFIVVEGYPELSDPANSFYVQELTRYDDGEEVILKGKIQKVNVNNGKDYYTLEGCRLLETDDYDNEDFDIHYDAQVIVEIEGEVDEDEQGVRVEDITVIDGNDDSNKDDDEDEDDENEGKGNGNAHGLLNALQNHFRNHGNNSQSTQRLMQLLQNRMGAEELEEALAEMEKNISNETNDNDYKILAKMYELKGKKYETIINGKKTKFDVPPMNKDGRTLAPFRIIAEALGANVDWDADSNTITVTKGDKEVKLKIGDKKAFVNGGEVILDVAAEVYSNRTLIPLRFLAEI